MTAAPALRPWHRASALVVGGFVLLHLANHVALLAGVQVHVHLMDALRLLYRQPLVEAVLLACVAFQLGSGLWLVTAGWRQRRGAVAWLQAGSGLVLVFFLLNHVGAVLYGRAALHLDTNLFFAAAGLHVPGWPWFFAPYYFLAVTALFAHLGCAWYWRHNANPAPARATLGAITLAGAALGAVLVAAMAGLLVPLEIPQRYLSKFLSAAAGAWPHPFLTMST